MNQLQGFSLIEVLIALFLSTTTLLALLQQQWQAGKFFNQLVHNCYQHQIWKNNLEAGHTAPI